MSVVDTRIAQVIGFGVRAVKDDYGGKASLILYLHNRSIVNRASSAEFAGDWLAR
jgi:hypothetical protein